MKAPPSHLFVDNDDNLSLLDPTKKEQNVSDLLKWISDVTIKRRKFRRTTRCSNLLAEAVLSSALRKARKDLVVKQEEKRKKAIEFSYQLAIKCTKVEENLYCRESLVESHDYQDRENSIRNNYQYSTANLNSQDCRNRIVHSSMEESGDDEVQACITSLDNFFSELKSIKV